MRLEITIEGGKPFYFPIIKECLVVGSSNSSDIKIPHMHVSRKHIAIHKVGEKFYLEDLGSTNGSFVNDEKLESLSKKEFTSFFPVRIGSVVFIALVPNSEDSDSDSTEVNESLSFSPSSEHTATKLVSDEKEVIQANPSSPKPVVKKNKIEVTKKNQTITNNQVLILCASLVLVGYYFFQKQHKQIGDTKKEGQAIVNDVAFEKKQLVADANYTDEDFIPRDAMETMLVRIKCVTEREIKLCHSITHANKDNWGATFIDEQMVVLVDGTDFYNKAKKIIQVPEQIQNGTASVAMIDAYEDSIWKLASVYFFQSSIGSEFPYKDFNDELLVFGLFKQDSRHYKLGVEIVAFANLIESAKTFMTDSLITDVQSHGVKSLDFLKKFYRTKRTGLQ